jgi:hypothetical protein
LPLRLDLRLRVDLKCATTAGVTHQFLNDLDIFPIGNEQRREGVAKGMPSNSLVDSCPQGRGANDLLQYGIWPERVFPLIMRARENPVISLPIRTCLFPQPEISGYTLLQGDRLARCLRLAIANVALINRAEDVKPQAGEINVAPFQGKQLAATKPRGHIQEHHQAETWFQL